MPPSRLSGTHRRWPSVLLAWHFLSLISQPGWALAYICCALHTPCFSINRYHLPICKWLHQAGAWQAGKCWAGACRAVGKTGN